MLYYKGKGYYRSANLNKEADFAFTPSKLLIDH